MLEIRAEEEVMRRRMNAAANIDSSHADESKLTQHWSQVFPVKRHRFTGFDVDGA
jgi:hypothetical protein